MSRTSVALRHVACSQCGAPLVVTESEARAACGHCGALLAVSWSRDAAWTTLAESVDVHARRLAAIEARLGAERAAAAPSHGPEALPPSAAAAGTEQATTLPAVEDGAMGGPWASQALSPGQRIPSLLVGIVVVIVLWNFGSLVYTLFAESPGLLVGLVLPAVAVLGLLLGLRLALQDRANPRWSAWRSGFDQLLRSQPSVAHLVLLVLALLFLGPLGLVVAAWYLISRVWLRRL
jgi:ribosomal protein S27AE